MDLTLQWCPSSVVELPDKWRCRVDYRLDGLAIEADVSDVADVAFEACEPVRVFPSWRGKRHYNGYQSMIHGGRAVGFESLTERACLIELDRLPSVVEVASQPMGISWSSAGVTSEHAPDYFVRLTDGSAVLIDVRPTERIDERARAQFDLTALLCRRLDWSYVVFEGTSKTRAANLRFLARFGRLLGHALVPRIPPEGVSLAAMADALGGGAEGLAECYGLLWNQKLRADLEAPLNVTTTVQGEE